MAAMDVPRTDSRPESYTSEPAGRSDPGRAEGTVTVYFTDNTYRIVPCNFETSVAEILETLAKSKEGKNRPQVKKNYGLHIISPGHQFLRERRLANEERPLEIQAQGGLATAFNKFKFLFKEDTRQYTLISAFFVNQGIAKGQFLQGNPNGT